MGAVRTWSRQRSVSPAAPLEARHLVAMAPVRALRTVSCWPGPLPPCTASQSSPTSLQVPAGLSVWPGVVNVPGCPRAGQIPQADQADHRCTGRSASREPQARAARRALLCATRTPRSPARTQRLVSASITRQDSPPSGADKVAISAHQVTASAGLPLKQPSARSRQTAPPAFKRSRSSGVTLRTIFVGGRDRRPRRITSLLLTRVSG
jgi:hypothetical protein